MAKSKYRNTKCSTIFQSETYHFDSKVEMRYFLKLANRLKRFEIEKLTLQPKFELTKSFIVATDKNKSGKSSQSPITYISDFSYIENRRMIVVDVKGVTTPLYNVKKKMFLSKAFAEFGVDEFHEVFRDKTIKYKKFS